MTKGFDYKGYKIEIASENNGFIVEIEPQKCSLPRLRWRDAKVAQVLTKG